MNQDYLLEKLDNIKSILDNKPWIKSYHIFLQSLEEQSIKTYQEDIQQTYDTTSMGCSLQILTTKRILFEQSYSISDIDRIQNLQEPSSTRSSSSLVEFPELSNPNISSISGDSSNTIEMNGNENINLLEDAFNESTQFEIPFNHESSILLETRVISTESSPILTENSLRVNYESSTQFDIRDTSYLLSRSIAGRSLDLNLNDPILELVNSTITRIKSTTSSLPENPAILLHPEVLGRLLTSYFAQNNWKRLRGTKIWSENINLYDDPTRSGGYYSTLFDDEGNLARPKQIVADGMVVSNLEDMRSSNWFGGGSGYRVDWFQPQPRAYNYNIRPAATNLVMEGGAGKGKYFTDRPSEVVLVRKGITYPGISTKETDFILHVHESELFENGDSTGPLGNFSISGNFDKILKLGHLSNDPGKMIDRFVPAAFYGGWLIIPPSTVSLRS